MYDFVRNPCDIPNANECKDDSNKDASSTCVQDLARKQEKRGKANGEKVIEQPIPDNSYCVGQPLLVVGVNRNDDNEEDEYA